MTPPPPPLPPPPSCYTTLVHHFHTLANKHLQTSITSKALAKYLDDQDALRYLQYEFHLPTLPTICSRSIYLCGNSLGLQPKKTSVALQQVLQVWSQKGVLGHTDEERPWVTYDEPIAEDMASTLLGRSMRIEN
ncbi:hypothetical protein HMI55_006526 [Coelomomyces lativittatus]|nr:hypothetical protein HMI55_006526 [Coelomomyces lativittatus]